MKENSGLVEWLGGAAAGCHGLAILVGLLVVYNGSFFVAAYFPNSCRCATT